MSSPGASAACFMWNFVLTFPDEVRYIWTQRVRATLRICFLYIRYSAMGSLLLSAYCAFACQRRVRTTLTKPTSQSVSLSGRPSAIKSVIHPMRCDIQLTVNPHMKLYVHHARADHAQSFTPPQVPVIIRRHICLRDNVDTRHAW